MAQICALSPPMIDRANHWNQRRRMAT